MKTAISSVELVNKIKKELKRKKVWKKGQIQYKTARQKSEIDLLKQKIEFALLTLRDYQDPTYILPKSPLTRFIKKSILLVVRVFIKYQNMDKEQEEKFMNYLIKHPKIVWVTYFDGDLDAAFLIWANNIMEFEKVYDEINEKFGIYFQEKYFSIATNIEYLKYKFLCDKINSDSLVFGDSYSNYELDELDKFILQELNINGRITLIELASKYNTSAKVIKSRIDKLVKNKIIIGFNIKLNHTLLGYTHRKILLKINNPSKEKIAQMITYLKTNKNVIYLVKPVGSFDFEFEIMTISNQEFHDIVKDLRSKFAKDIKSYNTVIHYFEPKSGQLVKF